MEEILASIRRIVVEESGAPAGDDDVLDLTDTVDAKGNVVALESAASEPPPSPGPLPPWPDTPLVSPSVEADVAQTLRRAGPDDRAIEDHLRAMLRPMLREWLDTHLPGIVERLVQGEIARIARRSGPG